MLNKIKLSLFKTTQKKIIISVLSFIMVSSFHSSLIFADSISSGSGTFTYGRYEYQKNIYSSITNINIDGTSINSYGTIVIDIYLYNTYTGNLYINGITGTGYINGGSYYCYGASFVSFDTDNNKIMLLISNPTDHVKVVYTINATDMYNFITISNVYVTGSLVVSNDVETTVSDIDVKLSSCENSLSEILALLESGGDINDYLDQIVSYISYINTSNENILTTLNYLLDFNELNIGFFNYKENFSRVDDTHILYEYETESLGDNYFMYKQSSNRSIQRINIDYETNNYTNGNYYVYNLYFLSQSVMDSTAFDSLRIYTRDYVSSMNVRLYDFKLYLHYFTHSSGKSVFNLTIYEPVSELSEYRDSRFQIDFQNFDVDASAVKFAYLGVVDSLPAETPYNYSQSSTEQSLEQTASDIDDVANQSSEIEEQYISDLTDFKNNLDLSDYDFSLHSNSGFTYLKEKLQDIYEINEFKPFYLVPIIFMVLTVILGG